MKILWSFLGGVVEWLGAVLLLPVHLKNQLVYRAVESQAAIRAAHARERQADAAVMSMLWQLGTDFRPLARHIAVKMHEHYGVRPSELVPGQVVALEKKS